MFGQLIYLIFYLIFSTQNWLEIEILELQKEIVERTKLTNIFYFSVSRQERGMKAKYEFKDQSYYIISLYLF